MTTHYVSTKVENTFEQNKLPDCLWRLRTQCSLLDSCRPGGWWGQPWPSWGQRRSRQLMDFSPTPCASLSVLVSPETKTKDNMILCLFKPIQRSSLINFKLKKGLKSSPNLFQIKDSEDLLFQSKGILKVIMTVIFFTFYEVINACSYYWVKCGKELIQLSGNIGALQRFDISGCCLLPTLSTTSLMLDWDVSMVSSNLTNFSSYVSSNWTTCTSS